MREYEIKRNIVFAFSIIIGVLLSSCGGGGGGGGGGTPPHSDITVPLAQAWSSMIINGFQINFNATGTNNSQPVSGSGTIKYSPAVATTFEGQSGMSVTETTSGSGTFGTFKVTNVEYYDSNYNPLGTNHTTSDTSDNYYEVVESSTPMPVNAHEHDTGTISKATTYRDKTKQKVIGSRIITYSIEPDSDTSVVSTITESFHEMSGAVTQTLVSRWRVTTAGNINFVSLQDDEVAGGVFNNDDKHLTFIVQPAEQPAGNVTGSWNVYYYNVLSKDSLTLQQSGNDLSGSWYGDHDGKSWPIIGKIDGSHITVDVQLPISTAHLSIDAQLQSDGQTMIGSWIVSGSGSVSLDGTHPWRATKRP